MILENGVSVDSIKTSLAVALSSGLVFLIWPGIIFEIGYNKEGKFTFFAQNGYHLSVIIIHLLIIIILTFIISLLFEIN